MKLIVMLQTMANNDRGWAKLVSSHGKVCLIQQGHYERVEIWEKGEMIYEGPTLDRRLYYFWDEVSLNLLSTLRVLAYTFKFTSRQKIDLIIGSNHNCGLAGLILKWIGKTRKTVTFMTDFLPIQGAFHVRVHRRITSWLNEIVTRLSDEVWLVSPRIPVGQKNPRRFVVPIVLNDNQAPIRARPAVGYIGCPTPDHGLEMLFDVCRRQNLPLHVMGDSPYLNSIRHLAPADVVFHGMVMNPKSISEIIEQCFCGYAVYLNTGKNSYSYYGIPSKTFPYFANNVPVVTTRTSHFSDTIAEEGIGLVVEPNLAQIESAILKLKAADPTVYARIISDFRTKWNEGVNRFHDERIKALCDSLE